ncbi:MAG: ribulose-phosphate 3-epimerase, partial [Acidobacteriota bacterium]|nr:ribulose-phosphate 3-epimerase [Acidobacteriota bacterium]
MTGNRPTIHIAPSILAADFMRLGEQVREAEAAGVDRVQIDVMDGHFVPNVTFGPPLISAMRPVTRLHLEAHLMVEPPEDFIEQIAHAGADTIIIHEEATPNLHRAVQQIHALGKKAGVAINPATPASVLTEIIGDADLILVMTVNPGFGGQELIASTLPKIRRVRAMVEEKGLETEVEVDGGINLETAPLVVEAGANVLVAGTCVFDAAEGVAAAVQEL